MKKNCPVCEVTWEDTLTIYERFLQTSESEEEAKDIAALYGATKENKLRFTKNVTRVIDPYKEVDDHLLCLVCKSKINHA